ncbi:N-acylmannosamine kinase/N-acetylmannosamine-6-phosphate 2-epimerase/N-acetylmannosamine kinase [Aminobacter lissarensis]|uniref:N-acylmannosamine kinase/N-acetylmannosamine-6-phosphate 2-epimerase/N-acetylmannosamine kinase n=1 Tax=Aminobacter carboxidus TaxID=376165 RepID=A0A8E1WI07_9HYPH|nr:ROK family protein [Aminobacter lissarensis]MBB6468783.1 N-acylmannosamine kinase/N-acetylmannosamine-6-phosphate 2-epimerase/N-acetylmannosamine kinase [Aminobacter lissarensis]
MTDTVLALDIGGTKMLAALVRGDEVLETYKMPTPRSGNPEQWLAPLFNAISGWNGRYDSVGVAVTGIIDDGFWSPLNRKTLDIPDRFPLVATVRKLTGTDAVLASNDAQAAAWGEFSFGAGQSQDLVFLTISTGIGGGIIVNGRLLGGVAGHFGLLRSLDENAGVLEDHVSGNWIAAQAVPHQPGATAREVFEAAASGHAWAQDIIKASVGQTALLCRNIKLMLDPARIVIGGGIGLAPGYLESVRQALGSLPPRLTPRLHAAALGESAGVVGIADLAKRQN